MVAKVRKKMRNEEYEMRNVNEEMKKRIMAARIMNYAL
jgi:hypothetical protein